MFRLFRRDREKGAAAVEFAIVLPLFLLLVFGIMESGWMFAQQVEIRNAAREGARLAVVDYGSADTIITATCDRADLSGAGATVTVTPSSTTTKFGEDDVPVSVTVSVTNPYTTLTGFLDPIFGSITLSSKVEMRTERPLDTLGGGGSDTCP